MIHDEDYDDDPTIDERERRYNRRLAEKVMGLGVPDIISDGSITLLSEDGLLGLADELGNGDCVLCGARDMALICPQCRRGPCRKCYEEKGITSCACTILMDVDSEHVM